MKGILMTPDNHLAIREGRKTVTRRLAGLKEINQEPDKWTFVKVVRTVLPVREGDYVGQHTDGHCIAIRPRYQVGDIVYIKESYQCYNADLRDLGKELQRTQVEYKDGTKLWRLRPRNKIMTYPDKWHSPMMMPEWAARDFIQITDVGAGRVQEITEEDAYLEGMSQLIATTLGFSMVDYSKDDGQYYRHIFSRLWDSINLKSGYGWEVNPWDFRYEFKRIEVLGEKE